MIELKVKKLEGYNKVRGLLGTKKANPVYFKTRFGIHTFGLRFPIDVLILDKSNSIVKLGENLKPYKIFLWNPVYNKVIELPAGEVNKNNIETGMKIRLLSV